MSSVVLGIVQFATGTLLNNVCDHIANRLKHGDCTDEKCRQLIVRELDEIKSKLDGLARKDLQSSVCFLKDGLCLLNYTLEDVSKLDEAMHETGQELDHHLRDYLDPYDGDDLPSTLTEPREQPSLRISMISEALSLSSKSLAVASKERFTSAKRSFENAYSKATEAFNNDALSTSERIFATKLRVISKILQCLEDPELAMAFCTLYLQQLHALPAVSKRFAVFFRSQVKSHLHKKKRAESIRGVMEINYALYEYAKTFTKTGLEMLSTWPKIKVLDKKVLHPLFMANKLLKKVEKCSLSSPNQFAFKQINNFECVAVNSKGEIITNSKYKRGRGLERLEVFSNNGEVVSSFCFDDLEYSKKNGFEVLASTVDLDDEVYVVTRYRTEDAIYEYTLSVFDANLDHVKQQVVLECMTGVGEDYHCVCIAVDGHKNVFITKQDDAKVFAFDHNGNLKNDFTLQGWNLIKDLKISLGGDLIAAELVGKTVGIYTEDGEPMQDIAIPGLHKVCGLAFDYIENVVVVLVEVLTGCFSEYRLKSYSECGELLKTLALPRQKETGGYRITSHPSGPLVVVHKTGVIFLHH